LSHFSVAHDRAYILPALRQILALDPHTEIFASPWSLPAWMKTNHSLNNLNYLGNIFRSDYRLVADYFVKFIRAYRRFGVPVAAVTLQNEPGNPTLYPGTELDAAQEGELLDHWVAPAFLSAGLHAAIYGGDLSWASPSVAFARAVASGPASPLLAGIAWHCYYGDPLPMSALHQLVPRLDQIVNECSPGITPYPVPELVISAMRNWASVVALWNLALNQHHGPVQVPNHGCPGCFGAITINDTNGTFAATTAYSGLGQASEFVQRGAQRIGSNHFVTYRYLGPGTTIAPPGLDDVAFLNPNGTHVLLAYNGAHTTSEFAVSWSGESFSYTLPARSTVTFMWPAKS
jgi:glucosylceramidase